MAKRLLVDDALLQEAQKIGKRRSSLATVHEALREYIDRRKRLKALRLFGTIEFDPRYDYKAERKKR